MRTIILALVFAAGVVAQISRVPTEVVGTWRGTLPSSEGPPQDFVLLLDAAPDVGPDAVVGTIRMPDNDAFLDGRWNVEAQRLELTAEFFPASAPLVIRLEDGRLVGVAETRAGRLPVRAARVGDVPDGGIDRVEAFERDAERPVTTTRQGLPSDIAKELDELMVGQMEAQGIVGLSIAIAWHGVVVDSRGYGWADWRGRVPATGHTRYRWASISKPLTAVAALMLERDGVLDLDRDVTAYVPEFPHKGHTVTSRLILSHLSGVCHYAGARRTWCDYAVADPFADRIRALDMFKDAPLVAVPGAKFHYSTHAYSLVGAAMERAARERYATIVLRRIAEPLGMTTLQPDYADQRIPDRARGYHATPAGRIVRSAVQSVAWKAPGGGWVSSVEDLARFGSGLLAGRLLTTDERARMATERTTSSGEPVGYGLGIGVRRRSNGETLLTHSGSQNGTATMLVLDPSRQLAVAVMANTYRARAADLAHAIHEQVRDVEPLSGTADFTWVWLKSGGAQDLPPARVRELTAGHFANMARLARSGGLVLAGPLGSPRTDSAHRGIFVLDSADLATAREWAGTDPAVQAGVFELEAVPWRGPAVLRRIPILDAALRQSVPPDAGPGATARPFVLVSCADAAAAERALAPLRADGSLLFYGRLGGEAGGALFALDAETSDAAHALLRQCGDAAPEWVLHPWFASRSLLQLPKLGR